MVITSPEALANVLKDHRKRKNLSQMDIAKRVGLKQTTVSAFEIDPRGSKMATLFKLLASLDLELEIKHRGRSNHKIEGWDQEW